MGFASKNSIKISVIFSAKIEEKSSYTNAKQCKMYGNLFVTKRGENSYGNLYKNAV